MVELAPTPTVTLDGVLMSLPKSPDYVFVTGYLDRLGRTRTERVKSYELRFAIAMLYETDFLFPQLVIDDFARQHHGEDGINFMFDEGDAFPRADVFGIRKSTGASEQLFMKQVDLARHLHCFAKRRGNADVRADAVVWLDKSVGALQSLPVDDPRANQLLRRSVRCFTTNLTDLDKIIKMLSSPV